MPELTERPRFADRGPAGPHSLSTEDLLRERYAGNDRRALRLSAYYALKPLLPRQVQLALRRAYASRQARVGFPAWPIEPILVNRREAELAGELRTAGGAGVPFVGEWPDGRNFAAILTHDVEGPAGVANVERLLEIEQRHGLVSSWNFVAKDYAIPAGLFDAIWGAGCEVGLHGIRHDGKLFANRRAFEAALPEIHRYLDEWGAVGFRSPATHRHAEWMPELGCLYDSSFPDTDPFEPQPGGCCSILPYFIGQLVELPITLVQDHTMWEILRHRSIDLWTLKSDWLIRNRGLVNVIVHPDYVRSRERIAQYEEFCAYLRSRLDHDTGWHTVPREVASWWNARSSLHLEGRGMGLRIAGASSDPLGRRATIAVAAERDGALVIDTRPGDV